MSESRTSERRLLAIDKQRQALELRLAGVTLSEIARMLGYKSASGVVKALDSAILRTLQQPADNVRALELTRLDRLVIALWPKALAGDSDAVRRVLDIMERRSKYLGLDANKRVEHSGVGGGAISITMIDQIIEGANDRGDGDLDS